MLERLGIHKRIVKMSIFEPILSTKSKIDILNVSVHPVDSHKKNFSAKIIQGLKDEGID